jgi:hypothetical protein
MGHNRISIDPYLIARALGIIAFLLVIASIAGQMAKHLSDQPDQYNFVWFFYLDYENNLPSVYSFLLLLATALLLAVIALLEKVNSGSIMSHWTVLSFGFLFMAADEALSFHERLILPVRELLDTEHYGVFYFAWVIPAIVIIFIAAVLFSKFLIRLPARTRRAIIISAILFIGGAIGLELVGGWFAELYGDDNLTYSLIVALEESLEMAGIITLIWALLSYIGSRYKEVLFQIVTGRPPD